MVVVENSRLVFSVVPSSHENVSEKNTRLSNHHHFHHYNLLTPIERSTLVSASASASWICYILSYPSQLSKDVMYNFQYSKDFSQRYPHVWIMEIHVLADRTLIRAFRSGRLIERFADRAKNK